MLRRKYLAADVGITGANFLIAETGSSVIVTNEGNGDLTQILPKVHIVVASLDKVVPTLEDVATILRVLARSATGQEFSAYTTISTGPKRPVRANVRMSATIMGAHDGRLARTCSLQRGDGGRRGSSATAHERSTGFGPSYGCCLS